MPDLSFGSAKMRITSTIMLAVLEGLSNFIGRKSYGSSFDPEPAALRPMELPFELPRPLFPGRPAPGS